MYFFFAGLMVANLHQVSLIGQPLHEWAGLMVFRPSFRLPPKKPGGTTATELISKQRHWRSV